MDYKKLQNGSDIRGIAMEGISGQTINLTADVAKAIGSAFGIWLSQKTGKPLSALRVGIGRDSRLTGEALSNAVTEGLCALGATVYECGMASTPAMFMSTVTSGFDYDGSIMVTASHLPFNRNGLKFFTKDGGLEKGDITAILTLAEAGGFAYGAPTKVESVDFISVYSALLVDKIRADVKAADYEHPLAGFAVVVDAGNGAGGFYVDKVLKPLGADTTGSQFLDPNGNFPNHVPNPEDDAAMDAIIRATLANKADIGIIFDTDVDRAGAVDAQGKPINRNRLIAMMAAILLEETPGTTIVTDSITSSGLAAFIESKGGIHHRFKRGYKNVINESIRLNAAGQDSQMAIETSGHGALKENYFLDDGAYLVTKMLIKMAQLKLQGRTIGELIAGLAEPVEEQEFRMNILQAEFKAFGNALIADLAAYAQKKNWSIVPNNYEGIRVFFPKENGDGWFLLRLSLHDPLIPLNIQSDSAGGVKVIAQQLHEFLKGYSGLDLSSIKGCIAD